MHQVDHSPSAAKPTARYPSQLDAPQVFAALTPDLFNPLKTYLHHGANKDCRCVTAAEGRDTMKRIITRLRRWLRDGRAHPYVPLHGVFVPRDRWEY